MRHHIFTTFAILAAIFALIPASTQAQDLDQVLFSVGTSLEDTDSDGQAWIYLLWQMEDIEALKDRTFAIYSKSGEPASPDPYVYEGTARTRLDPAAIQTLINRGIELGDDPGSLENDMDTLFEQLIPDASIPLPDKISAVVAGCLADPEQFENLVFLSRTHPTLSLVLGTGFASKHTVGEVRTWEVRECPSGFSAVDDCDTVLSRLTLKVGAFLPLPAPGQPVYVPFVDGSGNPDPRAHLNVPLRWSTPDDLRQRSLLQFGYNLYRMTAADALDAGFDANPPDPQLLVELADLPGHSTTRVNTVPILADRLLTDSESLDTVSDPQTYYIIDDNGRYLPGGAPFQNGEEYYYFVTARDILGRDGEVSDGSHVLICDYQPPPQPKGLRVTNHYDFDPVTDVNTQHFKVEWEAPETGDAQTPETITGYQVYRWWSIQEMQENNAFPYNSATTTAGGLVAVLPASQTEFIDNGSNAPFLQVTRLSDGSTLVDQNYANKTFWYTVRAIDGSACGGNLSGNSAPVYGVLRDRIGPDKPDGLVRISCYDIRVVAPREVQGSKPWESEPELGKVYLTLEGERLDSFVEWVEFAVFNPQSGTYTLITDRYTFDPGELLHTYQVKFPQPDEANPLYISCRMGGRDGIVSGWNTLDVPVVSNEVSAFVIYWQGESLESRASPGQACDVHIPIGPDGTVNGIDIQFDLTPSTEEWKVYRRVNDGRLTLISQGLDSASDILFVIVEDLNMPAKDARMCYFVQLFDQHGNPSPIVRIACIDVQGKESLPAPMLAPVLALGGESAPGALLSWFSPPYGIERFEVWVANDEGELPSTLGDDFESPEPDVTVDGRTWRPFRTGRISTTFPGNTPEFGSQIEGIALGEAYTFRLRALGPNGSEGPFSNEEDFIWNPDSSPAVSGPNVPWPALGLPKIQSAFNDGILARTVDKWLFDGGAVRISELFYGNIDFSPNGENESDFFFPPLVDPNEAVYKNADGESLLPFVLYRFQVPNAEYPQVSGDIYQVSPMMESIASRLENFPGFGITAYQNYDPFVFLASNTTRGEPQWFDLLVKDTQPVISGAEYRYLLVRFDPVSKEIAEIIPTNTLVIP
jgi:hypothetical protein